MNSAINNKADNSDLTALQGVVDGKMDEMTVDSAPTSGSANLVTSGGVYTAINNVGSNLGLGEAATKGVSTSVTSGDSNLVTGDAVFQAINSQSGGKKLYTGPLSDLVIIDVDSSTITIPQEFEIEYIYAYNGYYTTTVTVKPAVISFSANTIAWLGVGMTVYSSNDNLNNLSRILVSNSALKAFIAVGRSANEASQLISEDITVNHISSYYYRLYV